MSRLALAEVAHRSAEGGGGAFEYRDFQAAFGSGIGVGQTEDAGADDEQVFGLCHVEVL
jgi:hypothetical protein